MAEDKKPGISIEEQKPETAVPKAPGGPPAPEQGAQAVIPGMEGPPAPEGGQEREKPQEEEKQPRRGRQPKAKEAPAQGDKPKRKGRPAKSEKQTPGGGGAGKTTKAPKQDKAAGQPAPAQGEAPPEQPPQPRDASRGQKEEIVYLDLSELHPFQNHPFGVRDDVEMQGLVSSVKAGGVNQPALVRPREGGGYLNGGFEYENALGVCHRRLERRPHGGNGTGRPVLPGRL